MYNKLFSKIITSSIWLEPTPTRMIWITLLAVMDQDGFAAFASVANLAHTARIDLEEAKAAINILESPDVDSGDPEHEGRRIERVPGGWLVLNASKYRDIVNREVAREKTRERVARHRAKKNCNALVTVDNVQVTQSEADAYSYAKEESKNTDTHSASASRAKKNTLGVKELIELSGCTEQHAQDWLAIRKAKRAPMTRTAYQKLEHEAGLASITPADAIKVCAERGWQGFKADWLIESARPNGNARKPYSVADQFKGWVPPKD